MSSVSLPNIAGGLDQEWNPQMCSPQGNALPIELPRPVTLIFTNMRSVLKKREDVASSMFAG